MTINKAGELGTNVTELLKEDLNKWTYGDTVYLLAPMGSGKSYFLKNSLARLLNIKRILVLVNRTSLKETYEYELESRADITVEIEIMTYQALAERYKANTFKDKQYDIIFADECHYFLTDAWNENTNFALSWIMQQEYSLKFYVSATAEQVFNFIDKEFSLNTGDVYKYTILEKFDDKYAFSFFKGNTNDMLDKIMNRSKLQDKVVVFTQSAKRGYAMYDMYKECSSYSCSRNNPLYKQATPKWLDENYHLKTEVLISTSCNDNGIEIYDFNVKYIICDIWDFETCIQCLGRCRFYYTDKDGNRHERKDKIFVFIKDWTPLLSQHKRNIERQIKELELAKESISMHRALTRTSLSKGVYIEMHTKEVCINKAYESWLYNQLEVITEQIECKKKRIDFPMWLLQKLNLSTDKILRADIKSMNEHERLQEWLQLQKGELFIGKEGKKEIAFAIGNKDKKGQLITTIKTLNAYLDGIKLPYVIVQKRKKIKGVQVETYTITDINKEG